MKQAVIERLQQKSVNESLIERLHTDFNLAPMVSRTLVDEVSCYYDQCFPQRPSTGQMAYLAVSKESPAGRPLRACKRQPVTLTLYADEDLVAMKAGMAALRQARIQRLTEEAYEQGALLTHEDLACLLSSSLSTIKRDVQALRQHGLLVPTRGQIKDIGKGVSHRRQIVQDYLAGYTFSQIERRQRLRRPAHQPQPIRRIGLVVDFADTLMGVHPNAQEIGICNLSEGQEPSPIWP